MIPDISSQDKGKRKEFEIAGIRNNGVSLKYTMVLCKGKQILVVNNEDFRITEFDITGLKCIILW